MNAKRCPSSVQLDTWGPIFTGLTVSTSCEHHSVILGSGSGIDPSERSILGDTLVSLPGIQELFGVSSLSSAQPSSYVVSL
ncbi:uncharacterized protein PHACADRAFT_203248 [Phanerochaete carnosa HHB-10118-sp]|uniref:Uncharacterized protein n=1 Tax=Phanerochaete carnosa (strain HHB-10118-sp) TaxID=650164 RepID=K5VN28_PHACS|nr:uncharacterized protein PHACADRAFT_203248 [Phanerochaete carnosa HHB-10118-sp]EKM48105.1 hypothetical protein PHACADRAFT_203248 [Phanerochaete carnosa HHB-10118-sp]